MRVILLASLSACTWHTAYMKATFPEEPGPYVAPLIDPLTDEHAVVWLELEKTEGKHTNMYRTNAIVDTGGWRSMVSSNVTEHLTVRVSTDSRIRIKGVSGDSEPWQGAAFPVVRIGALELGDVPVGINPRGGRAIVGNELLSRLPVVIDRDRGLLTFGSGVGEDAIEVQLLPGAVSVTPRVVVRIGDQEVLLVFDTGAFATGIDNETGEELGLEKAILHEEESYSGVYGRVYANYRYILPDVQLGDSERVTLRATPIPKMKLGGGFNRKVVGILGMDFLRKYRVEIASLEGKIRLVPRGDPLASVRERVERWAWVPRCDDQPGCVRADYELRAAVKEPAELALTFTVSKAYTEGARFLFGFVDEAGALLTDHPLIEWRGGKANAESFTREIVARGAPGAYLWPLLDDSTTAKALRLLDVNPVTGAAGKAKLLEPLDGWQLPKRKMLMKRDSTFSAARYLSFSPSKLLECTAACAVDPKCRAFVYELPHDEKQSTCYLLAEGSNLKPAEGTIAGLKP